MPYVLTVYGRTFKGSHDVRPKVLWTYVLGTSARTSIEGMNDGERKACGLREYRTVLER